MTRGIRLGPRYRALQWDVIKFAVRWYLQYGRSYQDTHADSWRAPDGSLPSSMDSDRVAHLLDEYRGEKQRQLNLLREDIEAIQRRGGTDGNLEREQATDLYAERTLADRRALDPQLDATQATIDKYEGLASGQRPIPQKTAD